MNLSRHRRSRREAPKAVPPIEMSPMIKTEPTKHNVFSVSVSFSIFVFNSICVQVTNINVDNQMTRAPSNQILPSN